MLLWFAFAVMTAALIGAVAYPFVRGDTGDATPASQGLASVYKSQIAEIDVDLERGAVSPEEAAALRDEVGRRLLAETDQIDGARSVAHDAKATSRRVPLVIAVLVPMLSIGVYLLVGSPLLPSQPHAARTHENASGTKIAELVRRVEARLAKHPDDGKGWDVLAPVYMRVGRYDDAANAWRHAGRLLGETPERVFGYGEALIFAGDGIVSEEARRVMLRGVTLQPDYLPGQFWLAIAKQQDGALEDARKDMVTLLEKAGPTSPLGRTLSDHLKDIDARLLEGSMKSSGVSSSSSDTRAMIEGMVSGLAARLDEDGNDFEGWRRLIRSYVVLNRTDDARAALRKARTVFADDPAQLQRLRELGRLLKLEG